MFHKHRRWAITQTESPEDLAHKLTEHTWTCCTGYELQDYLFLNDATSADGAQEYAIVKKDDGNRRPVQVESITMSWCTYYKALRYIREAIAGEYDRSQFAHPVPVSWEPIEQHERCHLCA